jgi:hypothetical protein
VTADDLTALLDELDAAREKATPGEWVTDERGWIDADLRTVIGPGDVECMSHCYGGISRIEGDNLADDAALIVAAVNNLPKLTAALRAVLELAADYDDGSEWGTWPHPGHKIRDRILATLSALASEQAS